MIELSHITFHYHDSLALKDFSATFEDGRAYCLMGPNGCGKSTLFRILNGLSFPESGTYQLDGEEITGKKLKNEDFSREFHKKLGFVFQNPEVQLFSKTVEDEIAFGPLQLGWPKERIREEVDRYLELLNLTDLRYRAPFHMSGGEQKRCALASILIMNPQVLMLDEPVNGLDEDGEAAMIEFLKSMKSPDRTMIIATHRREIAEALADEVLHMTKEHTLEGCY
ncbi:MAG: ABC transporter ATP-binding protein [Lachnospiraceae bacterium]|nr:ABC transporter ATP-binding protein [Lachnospiraceae bacterium]